MTTPEARRHPMAGVRALREPDGGGKGQIPRNAADAMRKLRYWDRFYSQPKESLPQTRFELDAFRRHVVPERGQTAIDVGCGRGTLAAAMARKGMTVTGYDWSRIAIDVARNTHSSRRLGFAVHDFLTDAVPPGLEPGSVDVVACRLTMPYLEPEPFLERVCSWLRPDTGCLYLVVPTQKQSQGLLGYSEAAIEKIRALWRDSTRWDLGSGGRITALALRCPSLPLPRPTGEGIAQ